MSRKIFRHEKYICEQGHKFTHLTEVTADGGPPNPQCKSDGCSAVGGWVPNYAAGRPRDFQPVTVHVDKFGNYRFPGRADARVPDGYQKKEMNLYEARKFCKEMNHREQAKMGEHLSRVQMLYEEAQRENRASLRAAMQHMSPRERDFAMAAIEMGNSRDARAYYSTDCGFHIEGLE
jgi:hypothetical protein